MLSSHRSSNLSNLSILMVITYFYIPDIVGDLELGKQTRLIGRGYVTSPYYESALRENRQLTGMIHTSVIVRKCIKNICETTAPSSNNEWGLR